MKACILFMLTISNVYTFNLNRKLPTFSQFQFKSILNKDAYHDNIRLLRISTGLGTAECAQALKKTDNDVKKAMSLLENREIDNKMPVGDLIPLYEGVSTACVGKNFASIVELRCQTSFVSYNSMFGNLAANIASAITAIAETNNSKSVNFQDIFDSICLVCNNSFNKTVSHAKKCLQETLLFTRFGIIAKPEYSHFSFYSHKTNHSCPYEVGSSTSLVSFTTKNPENIEPHDIKSDTFCIARGKRCLYHPNIESKVEGSEFAREIAMHIVASSPTGMSFDDLGDVYMKEKERLTMEMSNTGKPPEIVDKIVQGRLRKQFAESLLLEQEWSLGNLTTKQVINNYNEKTGDEFKVNSFIAFNVKDDMLSIENKSDEHMEISSINHSL